MNTSSHHDRDQSTDHEHDHDHRLVTDGGTDLDTDLDPSATVAAELHYTTFADAETFVALVQRHGLEYAGVTDHLPAATPFVWGANPGTDEQVLLATGCHPVTGEFSAGGYREEGYASYLYLVGPRYAAEPLYQDVHETADRIKGEFQALAPVEGDGDADETGQEFATMTDGGTRTASTDTDTDTGSDPTAFGVLDEADHEVERVARERGAYLARTTDLAKREARAVAYSELGYSDAGTARRIGVAPTTVTGWLDRVAAQYGLDATFPTVETDRKDLHEVTREEVLEYSPGARATYREYAAENPGVVPGDVLAALSEREGANNEGDAK